MKQTARIISTYSSDSFGVCSALFELGGMTVMHDASGCNSTYTTHDEPRWYDMDSMVFISGLSEMEAIMGDDDKLIGDIVEAAEDLRPEFIALCGTPIPMMTGFDYKAVAEIIEMRTGIPAFGFPASGMETYINGASMALAGIAERFVDAAGTDAVRQDGADESGRSDERAVRVNVLGLTPLDFSINGTDRSICAWLEENGFEVVSRWAMGCTLEELADAGSADVDLVVSAAGIGAAEVLRKRCGIPAVIGLPIGEGNSRRLRTALENAGSHKRFASENGTSGFDTVCSDLGGGDIVLIGEGVTNLALASAIEFETGRGTRVLCATDCPEWILRECDCMAPDEDDLIPELAGASVIIADPLYRPICPTDARFIPYPSEAFSGRIYRDSIPDIVADPSAIIDLI